MTFAFRPTGLAVVPTADQLQGQVFSLEPAFPAGVDPAHRGEYEIRYKNAGDCSDHVSRDKMSVLTVRSFTLVRQGDQVVIELHLLDDREAANRHISQYHGGANFDAEVAYNGTGPWRGLTAKLSFQTDLGVVSQEAAKLGAQDHFASHSVNGFRATFDLDEVERWGRLWEVRLELRGTCGL